MALGTVNAPGAAGMDAVEAKQAAQAAKEAAEAAMQKAADAEAAAGNADSKADEALDAANNQAPTYTEATALTKLTSGEKLSVAMGKIAKAIADLITHLADTTKHITAAERTAWNGKAAGSHNHDSRYYTETEMDTKLSGKSDTSHTHDGRYYTESEMNTKLSGKSDTSHNHSGQSLSPASIEMFPGASAGHGGYIDFHYNNDAADYTSRLLEIPKGVLKYNNKGLLSTAHVIALRNVNVKFENGIATYENAEIKTSSVTFVQWRAGAVSTLTDSVLSTTPNNGSVTIVAKIGFTGGPLPVNILIINL